MMTKNEAEKIWAKWIEMTPREFVDMAFISQPSEIPAAVDEEISNILNTCGSPRYNMTQAQVPQEQIREAMTLLMTAEVGD